MKVITTILMAMVMSLGFTATALAERVELLGLTAEVPDGWAFNQEDLLSLFSSPDGEQNIEIFCQQVESGVVETLAKEQAGEKPVRMLSDGAGYVYEYDNGARAWGMLATDGSFCEFRASKPYEEMAQFIMSLEAEADASGMKSIIAIASKPEVVDWLSFVSPSNTAASSISQSAPAQQAEPGALREFSERGITAQLPADWQAEWFGEMVMFSPKEGGASINVILFPMDSDSYEEFITFATGFAKYQSGTNVVNNEGVITFRTKDGAEALLELHGAICMYTVIEGNHELLDTVLLSIAPQ